jgi:CDP-glucose 4,6-dehydratase
MEKKKLQMENLVKKKIKGKNILIIGNTGFVGSWLSLVLKLLGANILGISLKMNDKKYLSNTKEFKDNFRTIYCDLKNIGKQKNIISKFKPEILIHLASQPLVYKSYISPVETYETNIMGTIRLLEMTRNIISIKKILIFTSDKVYDNTNNKIHNEKSKIGGTDPYSSSKSCQDIISRSYSESLLTKKKLIIIRSGNIIGSGDWSKKRLIPDIIRSYLKNSVIKIRRPNSIRPWLYILDAIEGILLSLFANYKITNYEVFNLAPKKNNHISVKEILKKIKKNSQLSNIKYGLKHDTFKESEFLKLSFIKAKKILNWRPKTNIDKSLNLTIDGYLNHKNRLTFRSASEQIKDYFKI